MTDNRQLNRKNYSSPNRQYDSQGPDGKNRGTASQLSERYKILSREALATDRTLAEAFSQFADHYYRLAAESAELEGENERGREFTQGGEPLRDGAIDRPEHPHGQFVNGAESGNGNGNVAEGSEAAYPAAETEAPAGNRSPRRVADTANASELPVQEQADFATGPKEGQRDNAKEGLREGTRSPWGMSRRRRGQVHREQRQGSEEEGATAAPPEEAHAPIVVSPPPPVTSASATPAAPVEVAVAPRRRLTSTASRKAVVAAEATVVPDSSTAPAELSVKPKEEAAAPVEAKPVARRGRPRKVVISEEPAA